jgi:hypothetical protein
MRTPLRTTRFWLAGLAVVGTAMPTGAKPPGAAGWVAVGCAERQAIGDVAPSRLLDELTGLERVERTTAALIPTAGLVRTIAAESSYTR